MTPPLVASAWSAIELVGNHVWQSTLFAAVAGLLTLVFRRNRAEVRYWLWLAASVKFLVPFAALVTIGSQVGWYSSPAVPQPRFTAAMDAISQPFSLSELPVSASLPGIASSSVSSVGPFLLLTIWLCGCAAMLATWAVGWRRVAAAVRTASRVEAGREVDVLRRLEKDCGIKRPMDVVSSNTSLEPGVFGIFKPVLLWPRTIGGRLADAEIEAIIAHEVSHVRRYDNLSAVLHTVVQAAFWFHPLVWWLGTRLVDERERACDEDVIRLGSEPQAYAESLLKTCEFCVESRVTCVAGVSGSDLKQRIEAIMTHRAKATLNGWRRLLLTSVGVVAIAGPAVVGVLSTPRLRAQSSSDNSRSPAFEAPSVKLNKSGLGSEIAGVRPQPGGRFTATNLTVRELVALAYAVPFPLRNVGPVPLLQIPDSPRQSFEVASVKPNTSGETTSFLQRRPGGNFAVGNMTLRGLIMFAYGIQGFQLVGAPDWVATERFDITAKAASDVPPTPIGQTSPEALMLRSLLEDRFRLSAHRETRDLPIYALVLGRADGRLGPRLRQTTSDYCKKLFEAAGKAGDTPIPPGGPVCGFRPRGSDELAAGALPMNEFARFLNLQAGRIVVDRTGLTGVWDFDLKWSPPNAPNPDPDRPSIFTALQEQLGLRLDATTGPVDVLVIDRVERLIPD